MNMTTINNYTIETNSYWRMIRNASKEVRIRLATLILKSLTEEPSSGEDISDQEATERFLHRFCGSWQGNETAEEIIDTIYTARNRDSRSPICLD